MDDISHLANLGLIACLLAITMKGAFQYCDAAFMSERERRSHRFLDRWWPLRMSNCLILLSSTYYGMNCLQHPLTGTRLESVACKLVVLLGAALSAKGY